MLVRGEEGGNAINKLNRLIGPIIPEEKDPEEENPEGDEANKEGEENQDAENPEGSVNIWINNDTATIVLLRSCSDVTNQGFYIVEYVNP